MSPVLRPPLVVTLLAALAWTWIGCGPGAPSGFGRAIHLVPTGDEAHTDEPAGRLVVHAGEARRAWRTDAGAHRTLRIDATKGARLEVAVARAGDAPVRARIRIEPEPDDAAPPILERSIEGRGWETLTVDLSAYAGRHLTLALGCADETDARGAIDWGEPLLLERAPAAPPNIVLVTLDTTRADVAADPAVAPHLAGLARRGARFAHAWSAATSTTASHASILTGLPVERHGAVSNRSDLDPALETVAESLAARGYQTAASVTVHHIDERVGFGQGFDRFRPPRPGDALDGGPSIETVSGWLDDWAGEGQRPFFLWVHLFDPHTPYGPPGAFLLGELADRGFALPPRQVDPPTVPIFPGALPTPLAWLEGIDNRAHVDALYRAGVAYADHLVGRLIERLDALDLTDRTIFVVTADHGEALGEQGVFYQHAGLWPASLRVPLVVAGPGWPRGAESTARVSTLDIRPTLLAIAEGHTDEAPLRRALDRPDPARRVWFAETGLEQLGFRDGEVHFAYALGAGQFGVLVDDRPDGPHVRAIQRYAPGASWLFDIHADPDLTHNLAGDPGSGIERYRALVREQARGSAARARVRTLDPQEEEALRALGYAEP